MDLFVNHLKLPKIITIPPLILKQTSLFYGIDVLLAEDIMTKENRKLCEKYRISTYVLDNDKIDIEIKKVKERNSKLAAIIVWYAGHNDCYDYIAFSIKSRKPNKSFSHHLIGGGGDDIDDFGEKENVSLMTLKKCIQRIQNMRSAFGEF